MCMFVILCYRLYTESITRDYVQWCLVYILCYRLYTESITRGFVQSSVCLLFYVTGYILNPSPLALYSSV